MSRETGDKQGSPVSPVGKGITQMSENERNDSEIPESMLRRVARIIEHAEDCQKRGNIADAEADFAKADAIMSKYRIDRALVEMRKPKGAAREEPVSVEIPFMEYDADFREEFSTLLNSIARHNRCKAITFIHKSVAMLIGFPTDIEYTQMIWTSVHLAFASKIQPRWDVARTADENIKILKEAGEKWAFIAFVANEHGFECTPNDGRLKAAYRRQCKVEGVEPVPHTQRHAAYRQSYANGFVSQISTRLFKMRTAQEEQEGSGEPGTAVALRSRDDDVLEALYRLFPHLRPMSAEESARLMEKLAEEDRAEAARRAALTDKQRAAEDRAKERAEARWRAQYERERARLHDTAGRAAGASAARTVDLGAGKVGTGRAGEIER